MTRFNLSQRVDPPAPPVVNVAAPRPEIKVEAPRIPAPVNNAAELKAIAAAVQALDGVDLSAVVSAIKENTAALREAKAQGAELKAAIDAVAAALTAPKTVQRDRNGMITEVRVDGADY